MSNIQTGAERMPHDLSHLGFLAGQIGRLITISTTPVIAGDSFEMDAVGALRLSPLRRGLAIDSTVDIFTFYVPHRHVYGEQWIKFMKDGVNATPLPTEIGRAVQQEAETDLVCRLLLEKKKQLVAPPLDAAQTQSYDHHGSPSQHHGIRRRP